MPSTTTVSSSAELTEALASGATDIHIEGTITGSPMITLPPGVNLRGDGTLKFGAKGVRLTSNNVVDGVTVLTEDDEVAILNDTGVRDLGTLTLRNVRTTGQVLLVAEDKVRSGHVQIENLHIESAEVRGRSRRPWGFGVEALQGALTVWNLQSDPDVIVTAELLDISVGTERTPIRGSGILVGGRGDSAGAVGGGILKVSRLRTGEIHTNGGIPEATPDLISSGVFVISGGIVEEVINTGPISTYGQNDMVLDNWGDVSTWTATAPLTSYGPSGVGFVNFGNIDRLVVRGSIETNGRGARGFNLYEGSLREASFASIATAGDGSVGIQISKPLDKLAVTGDVATSGGEGLSLVKGVQVVLKAVALSIKPGGEVGTISIGGQLRTSGDNVTTVEIGGGVERLDVAGGIRATGKGSDALHVKGDVPGLEAIEISAVDGQEVVRES